jgi:putative Mn2+ efflux pump MntP
MDILPLFLFILPLGLDTLGVSISLGIKSRGGDIAMGSGKGLRLPEWFITAILFSLAETCMPLIGLAIGYTTSLTFWKFAHLIGPLILIGIGLWELFEEGKEYFKNNKISEPSTFHHKGPAEEQFQWRYQLLLALSISLDELAIGFSLGAIVVSPVSVLTIHPIVICILIGIQGFMMTIIGIMLGKTLRYRLRNLKELAELLSALLLVGLGIWLLVT